MGRGTHTSEETQGRPVLHPEDLWRHPPPPSPPLSILVPGAQRPPAKLPPPPPPPNPSKTTFLHSHYLFFVPSFCKKQSQKPVQNHQCGCPVLYYKKLLLI